MDDSPGRDGPTSPARWSRRRRRLTLAAAAALTVAAIAWLTAWGIANPGTYGESRDGCVTVSVPSSTGGALQHGCGDTARAMCRAAYAGHDRLSAATRPQCRLAGLGPQASPAG